jgi:hypothetical protein
MQGMNLYLVRNVDLILIYCEKGQKRKKEKKNTFWSNDESQYSMRGCRMWNEIYINFSHGPFLGFGREGNVE